MNQYSHQELDQKIHSFLSKKMGEYPDISYQAEDDIRDKAASSDRTSNKLLQVFTTVKTLTFN